MGFLPARSAAILLVVSLLAGCGGASEPVGKASMPATPSSSAAVSPTSVPSSTPITPSCQDAADTDSAAMSLRNNPDASSVNFDIKLNANGVDFCKPLTVYGIWYKVRHKEGGLFDLELIKTAKVRYDGSTTKTMESPDSVLCSITLVLAYLGNKLPGRGEIPALVTSNVGGPFTEPEEPTGRIIKASYNDPVRLRLGSC